MKKIAAIGLVLALGASVCAQTTYYVDARNGDDAHSGTSQTQAWKSLARVEHAPLKPGDSVLLHSGDSWAGSLTIVASGTKRRVIRIDRYGDGPLPKLDGAGQVENVLVLKNAEYIEVGHLEITNHGNEPAVRRGVLVAAVDAGVIHHVRISDLYIHDVNGTDASKQSGGILLQTLGSRVPTRFDDLVVERNIVWRVDRSAISSFSDQVDRSRWNPSLHVTLRDNYVEDIGGDGIVPWATDGALVEHNIAVRCNQRSKEYNAGIWPWSADNTLLQMNEASYTRGTRDGEGFDSDYNSKNSHFRYNYSHDNDGGFMLICAPVKRNGAENVGNTGTWIEYNISRNDHNRTFNLSGADQTRVEHNAIYTSKDEDVQILLVSRWDGWSNDALFRNNTFNVAGVGRYGHERLRTDDGHYEIDPGWGGATGIRFEGNRYYGDQRDLPVDTTGQHNTTFLTEDLVGDEPTFKPEHPELFNAYLTAHRKWMLKLFEHQFGIGLLAGLKQ